MTTPADRESDRESERETRKETGQKAERAAQLAGDRLPMRSYRRHDDDEEDEEREFTLSTASLLGLFLALVIVCGIFFGLGFSMGHRSSAARQAVAQQPPGASGQQSSANAQQSIPTPVRQSNPAPAIGAPATASTQQAQTSTAAASPSPTITLPVAETPLERQMEGLNGPPARSHARPTAPSASSPAQPPVQSSSAAQTQPRPAMAEASPAAKSSAGNIMVQVAAVVHNADANLLVSALRQQGYHAVVRSEPYDKLLHVQIGPFPTRRQADAMRAKLLGDGYDAILKP